MDSVVDDFGEMEDTIPDDLVEDVDEDEAEDKIEPDDDMSSFSSILALLPLLNEDLVVSSSLFLTCILLIDGSTWSEFVLEVMTCSK
jgi:hypothetical protein